MMKEEGRRKSNLAVFGMMVRWGTAPVQSAERSRATRSHSPAAAAANEPRSPDAAAAWSRPQVLLPGAAVVAAA